MGRGSSSRSKNSRQATAEEAVAAAGARGNVVDAGAAGGSRPYHECKFCKHGFTTAQALGGHMNIHSRDRGRRPGRDTPTNGGTASVTSWNTDHYGQYGHLSYPPAPPMSSSSFATYDYPGASAAGGAGSASQGELNLFGAPATHDHDLRLSLGSLMPEPPAGEPERSLDLELRLGRHPGWH